MAQKYYDYFDISEKEYEKLMCKECTKNGSNTESLNFCVGCESLFCLECLKNHEKEDRNLEWSGENNSMRKNYSNFMEKFIVAENNNSTRFNRNNHYNRSTGKSSTKSLRLNKLKEDLSVLEDKIQHCLHTDHMESGKRLDKVMEHVEAMIEELRDRVTELLDDFKQQLMKDIHSYHEEIDSVSSQRDTSIKILKLKTEAALREVKKAQTDAEIDKITEFVERVKTDVANLNSPEDLNNDKMQMDEMQKSTALFAEGLEHFIYSINTLGCTWIGELETETGQSKVTKKHFVQVKSDKAICDINGSCFMLDGTVILTDWNNCNIKQLDVNCGVVQTCTLPGIPWAVCSSGKDEVAVTLHYLQKIQFVSTAHGNLATTTSIKVRNKCKGIACSNSEIYVSCGGEGILESQGQIQVYDRTGSLLKVFNNDHLGNPLLSCPQHITISTDGLTLFIADKNIGLVILNTKTGTELTGKPKGGKKTPAAKGICLYQENMVLISDYENNEIVKFSTDGKILGTLNDDMFGASLKHPQSISCDIASLKTIVSCVNSNTILLCDRKIVN